MPDVAQLTVSIQASGASQAEDDINRVDKAVGKSSGWKSALGNAASIFAGFSAANIAADAVGFLKDQLWESIQAGMQANQVDAQLAAGLRSTHDASGMTAASLDDLATKLMNQTGITDTAVKSSESMLLTFTNIGKNVFPQATQAVADLATKMANGAVPSAQQMEQASIQLGKALGDPTKGYAQLQRVGVTFTKQQIDQIKTMEASGNIAGAQAVILKEMNKEFGGSAEAAGKANGGMAIFSATLDHAKEQIGQAILPVLFQLGQAILPLVQDLASDLPGAIAKVQGFFQQWQPVLSAVGDAAQTLGNVFMSGLKPAFDQIGDALSKTSGPGLTVKGVMAQVSTVVQQLTPYIRQAGQIIGQLAVIVVTQVIPAWLRMQGFMISALLPVLKQLGNFIMSQVVPAVMQLVGFFVAHVLPVLDQVQQIIVADVVPAFQQIMTAIIQNVWPAVKQLIASLEDLWNKISPALIPAVQFLGNLLKNVVAPIIAHTVVPAIGLAVNIVAGFVTGLGWLIGKVGDVLGILGRLKDFLGGKLTDAWNGLGTLVKGIWSGIGDAVKGGINGVIDIINGLIGAIDNISINVPSVGPFGGGHIGFSIPKIPHLASGGDVSGLFVGGEDGMELLAKPGLYNAPPGSHVYSASQTAALLGAGTSAPLTAPGSSGAYQGPETLVVNIAGEQVARIILPALVKTIRNGTGIRHMTA